jgi:hypothetical protein
MSVYFITGKLGAGKTLASVGRIREYLLQGRAVATNLDLNVEHLLPKWQKDINITRLPDKPNIYDLEMLPVPYEGEYNENKTGALVLDECGTWFNTREYRDKSRQPLINKLLHIRKAGWDVFFIIQHIEMIDKQVREGLGELIVTCQRMDKLALPLVTPLLKLVGVNARPPKIHIAIVKYGMSQYAPVVDRWVYKGTDLYAAYDTRQTFGTNDCGVNSMLSPFLVFGSQITKQKYKADANANAKNNIIKILRNNRKFFFLLGGLFSGYALATTAQPPKPETTKTASLEVPGTKTDTVDESNLLDNIRINASVKTNKGMEYYFWDDKSETAYIPENSGFSIININECKAKLMLENKTTLITCHSKFSNGAGSGVMPATAERENSNTTKF